MTVYDFTKLDVSGLTFDIINVDARGCMTKPVVVFSGDKNACRVYYGNYIVVHFEVKTARRMQVFVRGEF